MMTTTDLISRCKRCIHYNVCTDEYKNKLRCSDYKDEANFVEVVRCKDCKFYDKEFTNFAGKHICSHFDKIVLDDNNEFCSDGERRDA